MVDAQFFSELRDVLLESPEELDLEAYRATFTTISMSVPAGLEC
jgi:hypothetical protein